MAAPLVSVILPLYNETIEYAKKAIDSILNQTYKNLEVILILDNPLNGQLRLLMDYFKVKDERVILLFNEQNLGLPETLNRAIDLANGEFIARMDGDDVSVRNRIEKQLGYLLLNKNIDLVGSDSYIIDEDNKIVGEYNKLETDYSQKFMLRKASTNLIHPTWFGKASVFKTCRYRNFEYCEDYDFLIRAYAKGYNFRNLKEKLLYYRIQNKSISRKHAYEQYINSLRIKKQYTEFKRNKQQVYPELPELTYNQKDKTKFDSTLLLVNKLREAFFKKHFCEIILLVLKIALIDRRPLSSRLQAFVVYNYLRMLEKIIS